MISSPNSQNIIYLPEAQMDLDPMLIGLQHPSTNHREFEIRVKTLHKKRIQKLSKMYGLKIPMRLITVHCWTKPCNQIAPI